jgi:hypothetical protein
MEVEIITKEDLAQFKKELLSDIRLMLSQSGKERKEWLKSPDVCKMLDISTTTLQTLRTKGIIPSSKIGGTLFYRLSDIEDALKKSSSIKNLNAIKRFSS